MMQTEPESKALLDRQLADRAFWDYYRLPPDKRNLSELLRTYKDEAKSGGQPPSRRRETLTRWRQEGDWDGRVAELDKRQMAEDLALHQTSRQDRLKQLNGIAELAVTTLKRLAENDGGKVPASVQLQASEAILDRVGLSRKGKNATIETESTPVAPPATDDPAQLLDQYNAMKRKTG